jgi:hypothetical protein
MGRAYYSNCLIETWRARRRLRLMGVESYVWRRASRYSFSPFHSGWGVIDPDTGLMRMWSFKPIDGGEDVPLYMAWTRLIFKGSVVEGDAPVTKGTV